LAQDPITAEASVAMAQLFGRVINNLQTNIDTILDANSGSPFNAIVKDFTNTMITQLALRATATMPPPAEPAPHEAPTRNAPDGRKRKRRRARRTR
jgi:hypothetical protein